MPEPKRPTFTRQPVAPPPPSANNPPPVALPTDRLLPRGAVQMTEYTRRQLQLLGWKDGDPVPGDFGQQIKRVQAQIEADTAAALAAAGSQAAPGSKVKIAKLVDLSQLPPDKQQELAKALVEYKKEVQAQEAADAAAAELEQQVVKGADATVQSAHRAALQAAAAQTAASQAAGHPQTIAGVETVLTPPTLPAALRPREGAVVAGVDGLANFVLQPPPAPRAGGAAAPSPPSSPPPAVEAEAEAGGVLHRERCPRCLWALSMPFDAVPDVADKQRFVVGILGNSRFTKTYALLGGQLNVTFRSLLADEVDTVFKQLRLDIANGDINNDTEYMAKLAEYRLILSVSQIADGSGQITAECPPLHELSPTPAAAGVVTTTPLPQLRQWFNTDMVPQEPLRRIVVQKHREFQRLTEALEAMSSTPDFWNATASHP